MMACCLAGAKPLSEPRLEYCSKFIPFHARKHIWKCRLENSGHFVSASVLMHVSPGFNVLIRDTDLLTYCLQGVEQLIENIAMLDSRGVYQIT